MRHSTSRAPYICRPVVRIMSIGTWKCHCLEELIFASLSRAFLARNRCVFSAPPVLPSALVLPFWCLRSASFWCVSRVFQVRLRLTVVQLLFARMRFCALLCTDSSSQVHGQDPRHTFDFRIARCALELQ